MDLGERLGDWYSVLAIAFYLGVLALCLIVLRLTRQE